MKQSIPSAALSIIPNAGHAINIEEPDEYNRIVGEFLSQVDSGRGRCEIPELSRV
jgi:pimeloyl-ACP methyl ester carboxylesterase